MEYRSFTIDAQGILGALKTKCEIFPSFDPSIQEAPKGKEYIAIWDTGATSSVISEKVAHDLGLQSFAFAKAIHAGGTSDVPVYRVNIMLPNKVGIAGVRVSQLNITGADVLIGMDIISKGDFAITHVGRKTKFTFRIPSLESIDFVASDEAKAKKTNVKTHKVGRNELCPCGSGKKYKKCYGKN